MRAFDFSPLFRSTVGFDRLFDLIDSYAEQSQGYPPYNIERSDETHYRITLAVAGFAEKDLGIAGRAFERRFQLAEHVEVRQARLENGLLHIDLERVIPEEKKPRQIPIGTGGPKIIEGSAKAA
jgi:molecular chaperone IbpA